MGLFDFIFGKKKRGKAKKRKDVNYLKQPKFPRYLQGAVAKEKHHWFKVSKFRLENRVDSLKEVLNKQFKAKRNLQKQVKKQAKDKKRCLNKLKKTKLKLKRVQKKAKYLKKEASVGGRKYDKNPRFMRGKKRY